MQIHITSPFNHA